jgi:hypothetical protein
VGTLAGLQWHARLRVVVLRWCLAASPECPAADARATIITPTCPVLPLTAGGAASRPQQQWHGSLAPSHAARTCCFVVAHVCFVRVKRAPSTGADATWSHHPAPGGKRRCPGLSLRVMAGSHSGNIQSASGCIGIAAGVCINHVGRSHRVAQRTRLPCPLSVRHCPHITLTRPWSRGRQWLMRVCT